MTLPDVQLSPEDQLRVEAWLAQAIETIAAGRRRQKQLGDHAGAADLGESEALLLWTCARQNAASQRILSARLGLSTGQVSGVLEGLRRRGLLTGRRSEIDRRRQAWSITDAGRAALAKVQTSIAGDPAARALVRFPAAKSKDAA